MSWTDTRTEFAHGETLGASTGTEVVGSVIDTEYTNVDFAVGHPVYVHIIVETSFDSATDGASVEFQLVTDSVDPPAADGSETVHFSTGAIPEASLAQGFHLCFPVPAGGLAKERYMAIQAVTTGEALTAGAVTAYIGLDAHDLWAPFEEADD